MAREKTWLRVELEKFLKDEEDEGPFDLRYETKRELNKIRSMVGSLKKSGIAGAENLSVFADKVEVDGKEIKVAYVNKKEKY